MFLVALAPVVVCARTLGLVFRSVDVVRLAVLGGVRLVVLGACFCSGNLALPSLGLRFLGQRVVWLVVRFEIVAPPLLVRSSYRVALVVPFLFVGRALLLGWVP